MVSRVQRASVGGASEAWLRPSRPSSTTSRRARRRQGRRPLVPANAATESCRFRSVARSPTQGSPRQPPRRSRRSYSTELWSMAASTISPLSVRLMRYEATYPRGGIIGSSCPRRTRGVGQHSPGNDAAFGGQPPLARAFAQLSRSPTVRLKMSRFGALSRSAQK